MIRKLNKVHPDFRAQFLESLQKEVKIQETEHGRHDGLVQFA